MRMDWQNMIIDWQNMRIDWEKMRIDWQNMRIDWQNMRIEWQNMRIDWLNMRIDWQNMRIDWQNMRIYWQNVRIDWENMKIDWPVSYHAATSAAWYEDGSPLLDDVILTRRAYSVIPYEIDMNLLRILSRGYQIAVRACTGGFLCKIMKYPFNKNYNLKWGVQC